MQNKLAYGQSNKLQQLLTLLNGGICPHMINMRTISCDFKTKIHKVMVYKNLKLIWLC